MKKAFLLFLGATALFFTSCKENDTKAVERVVTISEGLKFGEGSVPYLNTSVLVSNFGTDSLSPLNNEGKGYIVKVTDQQITPFIPADGNLSAPKGMAIADDYLYIADVQKIVVYNLKNKAESPKIITLPDGELFANDIAIYNNYAYISVTNTGAIYKLNIATPTNPDSLTLTKVATVTGANGLAFDGKTLYVASFPADGKVTENNVIYKINDITAAAPSPEEIITTAGMYDGLAIYKSKLYFSNWANEGEVGYIDMATQKKNSIDTEGKKLSGPADISLLNGKLYVPNLPESELTIISVK
ncbi:hypothetical protein [Tenacibaculum maritimum]|uniref:hypothetical protein n=1 Tax=Tenacibaculum maritimum TaxID=107401 RepID=UPI001E37830A|nr:hypothetical protein [Tenacibaculum maritimum]MCD9563186.1 hypothetical protein [Tenacibaculum maritimum]MCD9566443.1 hypothetical protein [Tenacibaculum maritimum]MCD9579824.1 hypothetical protein [Tenacibaculum maritimum]MCD9597218.1 hypothetical protein [Tenacibaculum maritimum]MCD9614334.1 hypothetical protein [Tenacibaculum maritimum]